MVALIRSLLPGGPNLLKPETLALLTDNQLADGVWLRFAMMGELKGKAYGLGGGLILQPSPIDHPDSQGEIYWGGRSGTWQVS